MNMINTENAVKIQIYVAIIAYCLVAIAQSNMGLNMDTYDVLRILTVSLLTRMQTTRSQECADDYDLCRCSHGI